MWNLIDRVRAADARGRDRINASRSRWLVAQVATIVVFALASMYIFTLLDGDADAAEPSSTSTPAYKCVDDTGIPCGDWADKKTSKFKKGKLDNSKGLVLPAKWQKKITKKMVKKYGKGGTSAAARYDGDWGWWKRPLTVAMCGYDMQVMGLCLAGQPDVAKDVVEVKVTCGGTGVIGSLGNGGIVGFGKGAGGCLFARLAISWFN